MTINCDVLRAIARRSVCVVALLLFFSMPSITLLAAETTPGVVDLCQAPPLAHVRCSVLMSVERFNARGNLVESSTPQGYGAADLQSAYGLDTSQGAGRTVAIIGAYNARYAETDLAAYRTNYGLPACPSSSQCFTKLNQEGQPSPLPANAPNGDDWDTEYSLQMDMVSAACPACNITLVEANDDQGSGLYVAINTAAALPGVVAIAAPFGGAEYVGETDDELNYFYHPGIAIVASAGDIGYGAVFPASSQYVVAVGGTTLSKATNARGWLEKVWNGTSSGCSAYIAKPAFQSDAGCTRRTVADVAVVGDPNTGVAIYSQFDGGWEQVGGTTTGSGIIAGVYALAGASAFPGLPASYLYRQPNHLNDVTVGTNGNCGGSYLCSARIGYDGPSGNGTPAGIESFIDDTVFENGFEN